MHQLFLKLRGGVSTGCTPKSFETQLENDEVKKAINTGGNEELGLSIYTIPEV